MQNEKKLKSLKLKSRRKKNQKIEIKIDKITHKSTFSRQLQINNEKYIKNNIIGKFNSLKIEMKKGLVENAPYEMTRKIHENNLCQVSVWE